MRPNFFMFLKFFNKKRTKKSLLYKLLNSTILRTPVVAFKILWRNESTKEACTLSYYGLLSCIPILVFFLRLSQYLFSNIQWQEWLVLKFPDYKEPIHAIVEAARNSSGSNIGLVLVGSFFVFCWAGILMLLSLEDGLNKIFRTGRTPVSRQRLIAYLIIILISPMIFIILCGAWVYITQIMPLQYPLLFKINSSITAIYLFSRLVPYVILYLTLFCLFSFLPRVFVDKPSALISSLIVGSIWIVFQKAFFCLQALLFNYSFTYGALVALPSVLLLLYSYATIYLFGGALTFVIQNRGCVFLIFNYKPLPDCYLKLTTITYILAFVTKCFNEALPAPTAKDLSKNSNLPIGEISQCLDILENEGLILSLNKIYQPAHNLEKLTIKDIIQKLMHADSIELLSMNNTIHLIQTKFRKLLKESGLSNSNLTLSEIAKQLR